MKKIVPLVIRDKAIELIPISLENKSYLEDFHQYSIEKRFYEFLTYEPFKNYKETLSYINKLIKRSAANNCQYWFIKIVNPSKVVGSIGLLNADFEYNSVEIWYGISPDYWGKGIFKNAAELLIKFCIDEIKTKKIIAKTSYENKNSIKALKKLSFYESHIIDNYYQYSDGHYEDAQFMTLDIKE